MTFHGRGYPDRDSGLISTCARVRASRRPSTRPGLSGRIPLVPESDGFRHRREPSLRKFMLDVPVALVPAEGKNITVEGAEELGGSTAIHALPYRLPVRFNEILHLLFHPLVPSHQFIMRIRHLRDRSQETADRAPPGGRPRR